MALSRGVSGVFVDLRLHLCIAVIRMHVFLCCTSSMLFYEACGRSSELELSSLQKMADPLGCIQTADAIAGLITAIIRVVKYCQKLGKAAETAQRVLVRMQGLEPLLEAVRQICKDKKTDMLARASPRDDDGIKTVRHIESLVKACKKSVYAILTKLGAFYEPGGSISTDPGLWDAKKLVGSVPDIEGELENLAAHKHTLGLWFNVLT